MPDLGWGGNDTFNTVYKPSELSESPLNRTPGIASINPATMRAFKARTCSWCHQVRVSQIHGGRKAYNVMRAFGAAAHSAFLASPFNLSF